jgi:hypothetical protein
MTRTKRLPAGTEVERPAATASFSPGDVVPVDPFSSEDEAVLDGSPFDSPVVEVVL